jgi:hypothetical protein
VFSVTERKDNQALSFKWTVGATDGKTGLIELDGMWNPSRAR